MKNEKHIPTRCIRILDDALRHAGIRDQAQVIFILWPNLKQASLRLCSYLSPFVLVGDIPLLEIALARATGAACCESGASQMQAFIQAIASIEKELRELQVSVLDRDDNWIIWDFDSHVTSWLEQYRRDSLQVRPRETPFMKGPVLVALLSRVFTTRDLMMAGIELHGDITLADSLQ